MEIWRCTLDTVKLNKILLKSIGVDFIVNSDGKHTVDTYVNDVNFNAMITYVANCFSTIISNGYIAPFDVVKKHEQVTGYDVTLHERNSFDAYPVNLVVTPGMYIPIGAYAFESMGIKRDNELDLTNLTNLFRDLLMAVEPGATVNTNPFSLMIISSKCPSFMQGMFPAFAPSLFNDQNIEAENIFTDEATLDNLDNPFLSDPDKQYDNSEVLGL